MRRKMMSASTRWMPITYSGNVSCLSSASGSRYRKTSELMTSRRMPCSCSVSGRAFSRARSPASGPAAAAGAATLGSAIRPFVLDLDHFLARPEERLDHAWIEMLARLGAHVIERVLARPGSCTDAPR